jgi:hypothetical protein
LKKEAREGDKPLYTQLLVHRLVQMPRRQEKRQGGAPPAIKASIPRTYEDTFIYHTVIFYMIRGMHVKYGRGWCEIDVSREERRVGCHFFSY